MVQSFRLAYGMSLCYLLDELEKIDYIGSQVEAYSSKWKLGCSLLRGRDVVWRRRRHHPITGATTEALCCAFYVKGVVCWEWFFDLIIKL